jgi:hypothetical protein
MGLHITNKFGMKIVPEVYIKQVLEQVRNSTIRKIENQFNRVIREMVAQEATRRISPAAGHYIRSLKTEKRENWGAGTNVTLSEGRVQFFLTMNPRDGNQKYRIPARRNIVWAIISSDKGRKAITVPEGQFLAMATQDEGKARMFNHGVLTPYWGAEDDGWYVVFAKHSKAQRAEKWIGKAILRGTTQAVLGSN